MRDTDRAPAATTRARLTARLGIFTAALALAVFVLAPSALAVPFHPREEARDITGLNQACGTAVDSKGDVYLSSAGTSEIKVYDPSHVLLTSIPDSHQPCGLAVTTTGNLYVSERATGEVVRFKPNAYPFSGTPTYGAREVIDASGLAKGISVDPFDNALYVAEGSRVSAYDAGGSLSAHIGEGTLTEASGVAAYSYRTFTSGTDRYLWIADAAGLGADRLYLFGGPELNTLKLRRELKGTATPDGSFGFGAAGAYLAADPGNREAAGDKCIEQLGNQACTAGHLFLYDAAHKALDEFDASGEYLDQVKNAAFADAEPTAIAIDRSGTSGDGTVYVTAGAGAGAKALAFGPLKAPSRKTLGEPISHVLAAATAVATDSRGYVYVVTNAKIHVFKPDGTEIKTAGKAPIEDKENPWDLAVDSTGKVYVLDKGEKEFASEAKVTYYTPSAYPPVEGTTYARHESIVTPAKFPVPASTILKGIAVNPGPGSGKDHLFVTDLSVTQEYDSAANGSGLLNSEFAKGLSLGLRQSIAVNGQNGNVYFGANVNAPLLAVVSPDGKEVLARINEAGGPKGPGASNPLVAVDQANGHVVEFDGARSTAREYDASGGFVAEFGNFTEGITREYRVALDSACAVHEPPLTGSACEAFDPANGNVYIAFDDSNALHPPYDVTAFGPLTYPAPAKHKLTVKREGTGSGKVESTSPASPKISCGSECEKEFEETQVVTLVATPNPGSEFVKWEGCEAEPSPTKCEVTMSKDREVKARFEPVGKAKFKLTVKKEGTGAGKVTSSPAGIDCGATCSAEFEEGTEVTLSASAEPGSVFGGWSGSGCSGTGTCKVTMSAAREVTASFTLEQHKLTVEKKGTGTGTVTSSPAGISCGSECSANFDHGTAVTLTGASGAKTKAVAWSGCDSVNIENKCLVTMTSAKSVTATFDLEPVAKFKLTVKKEGTGSGKVTSSPAGIDCGATCSAEFEEGTEVTLSASAEPGSVFGGWSGSGCSGTGTCKVTMSAAREVTASFEAEETGPINPTPLTVQRTGEGTVVSSPAGIECGVTCKAEFEKEETVTLTASPASGYAFSSWSGCATHAGLTCTVVMSSAKTVKASFFATPALTIEKAGSGSGKAMAKGISCDAGCSVASAEIKTGTLVEVKTTPSKGSEAAVFESGTGSASSCSGNTCTFTITEDSSVKVKFSAAPMKDITVELTGPAAYKGKVKGKAFVKGLVSSGINCGSGCTATTESFFATDTIELTASAATGYAFEGWTVEGGSAGTCTGKTTPCMLPTDVNKTVKAEFK